MRPTLLALAAAAVLAAPGLPASAQSGPLCTDLGFAGLLARCNREVLPPLTLSAGKPLAAGPMTLRSGVYYTLHVESDGTQELALVGPEFFRAVWFNEIVISDIEIRPMAVDSLEFDSAGKARVTFVAIKPGKYQLKVPGSTGDSQRVEIVIQ